MKTGLAHTALWEGYGSWLLQRVGFRKRGYSNLMEQLHHTEYTWGLIQKDENRAADGMKFRDEYWDSLCGNAPNSLYEDILDTPCSVLEMLVGLAIRVDTEYIGNPKDPRPDIFFWEMCCNLGLKDYKNSAYKREKVDVILQNWLTKNHNYNGFGTIFPVSHPINDHREMEIWSQMMEYLTENYHF